MIDYPEQLSRRLQPPPSGFLNVRSRLRHFALINYTLPKSRLEKYIPQDRFEIQEFDLSGGRRAMLSVVPFLDEDFHFIHLFPFLHFQFAQTNHRVYVVDRETGESCVWFFGTTLGSQIVRIPRILWRIPWHHARYQVNCQYDSSLLRYDRFHYSIESDWCRGIVDLADTGAALTLPDGFSSMDEMTLILTHPLKGYFYRMDSKLGHYAVWHKRIKFTKGIANDLYFSLYEDLNLLSRPEMQNPHSVFICPETLFEILLPPRRA